MQKISYDAEVMSANPLVSLNFNESAGSFKDSVKGLVFSPSAAGAITYGQPSSIPGRKAVSMTYDASLTAPNNTLANFDWNTPWWAIVRVQVQVTRSGFTRVPLFSKGPVNGNLDPNAGQGFCAYLYWVGSGVIVRLQMTSATAAGSAVGMSIGSQMDVQNGNSFTIVFTYDGSGSQNGMNIYVEGISAASRATYGNPTAFSMSTSGYPLTVGGVFANTIANQGANIHNNSNTILEHFAIGIGTLDPGVIYNLISHGRIWKQLIGAKPATPKNVIWCNDGDQDSDNVFSLAACIRLHQLGYIRLRLVNNTQWNDLSVAMHQQFLDQAGLHHILASSCQGTWSAVVQQYSDVLCTTASINRNNATHLPRASYPTDVVGYRTTLAACPNASVSICIGGAARGLYDLLQSPADSISGLTGLQLFAAKVSEVHILDNPGLDPVGSQAIVSNNGTIPVYFHGASVPQAGPGPLSCRINTDPLFNAFNTISTDIRPAWDIMPLIGILTGVPGIFFDPGAGGTISYDAQGNRSFASTPDSKHYQVSQSGTIYPYLPILINALCNGSPQGRREIIS